QTAVPRSYDGGLHTLFEKQAARTPDVLAATFSEESLTYQQLNAKADHLARRLCLRNVGSGVRVGLYIERSLEMAIALLAVLKAGGVYVPLDVSDLSQRTELYLRTIPVDILLTQHHLLSKLPPCQATTLFIEQELV